MPIFKVRPLVRASRASRPQWSGSLAAAILIAVAPQLHASVVYDDYRGSAFLPTGATPLTPNYVNTSQTPGMNNLIAFANGGPANVAESGSAPNIAWNWDDFALCDQSVEHSATRPGGYDQPSCDKQLKGRVIYGVIEFPEVGDYKFFIDQDDGVRLDFSSDDAELVPDNAANFREFSYDEFYRGDVWSQSQQQGPDYPVSKAGTRKVFRLYWNQVGGYNYLRFKWQPPGATQPEPIPADVLRDPGDPKSYEHDITAIPTLGEWGLVGLSSLLAAVGFGAMLRRRREPGI